MYWSGLSVRERNREPSGRCCQGSIGVLHGVSPEHLPRYLQKYRGRHKDGAVATEEQVEATGARCRELTASGSQDLTAHWHGRLVEPNVICNHDSSLGKWGALRAR